MLTESGGLLMFSDEMDFAAEFEVGSRWKLSLDQLLHKFQSISYCMLIKTMQEVRLCIFWMWKWTKGDSHHGVYWLSIIIEYIYYPSNAKIENCFFSQLANGAASWLKEPIQLHPQNTPWTNRAWRTGSRDICWFHPSNVHLSICPPGFNRFLIDLIKMAVVLWIEQNCSYWANVESLIRALAVWHLGESRSFVVSQGKTH